MRGVRYRVLGLIPAYIGSTPIATEMVVPVVIEGANKTESWFESTAAHSEELQSSEIRFTLSKVVA